MGINFPNTPTTGQIYPTSGSPQYRWDGEKWSTQSVQAKQVIYADGSQPMTAQLTLVPPPVADTDAASKGYVDSVGGGALAYSGMQINGSMDISQENGSGVNAANNKYVLDGWIVFWSGTMALSASQQPIALALPGLPNCLFASVPTAQASLGAGDYATFIQRIEGYRIARLGWGSSAAQPVTLGFWVRHSVAGTYSGSIRNSDASRSYAFAYTQNTANAYEYKTITIPGCTDGTWLTTNGIGMHVAFTMASGSTNTAPSANSWLAAGYLAAPGQVNAVATTSGSFLLTGVVVLPGTQAPTAAQSPLIMRPYDQELITCKRYWQPLCTTARISGYNAASGTTYVTFPYPVAMRAAPTVTLPSPTYVNASGMNSTETSTIAVTLFCTVTAAGGFQAQSVNPTLDARL